MVSKQGTAFSIKIDKRDIKVRVEHAPPTKIMLSRKEKDRKKPKYKQDLFPQDE